MHTILRLSKERRSIRSYKPVKIDRSYLELCCDAGRHAPSACDSQPWKFIIVDDDTIRNRIDEAVFSGFYTLNSFARQAPALIVQVSERIKISAWIGGKLKNMDFRRIDTGIACSHIVLQAQELGLGTCILGWFDEKKLKKILQIPRSGKVELVIAIGYQDKAPSREKMLKDRGKTLSLNKY